LNARPRLSFIVIVIAAILAALTTVSFTQSAQPPSLTLLSKDGRRPLPIALVGDQDFVALDDLAAAFQLTVREDTLGAVTVSYKGKTIVLTADQPLASVAGRMVSLPAALSRGPGRRWVVPVEFINRALALIFDSKLDLRKASRLVLVGDVRVPRITARYDSLGASGRLTIDATPSALATVTQDGSHLTIKFDADALDAPNPPLAPQSPQSLVLAARQTDAVTLAVDLGPRVNGFKSSSQPVDTTMRLVIDVMTPQTEAAAAPAPAANTPQSTDLPPALSQPAIAIRTVAIDPGHGGDDEGAHGMNGAKEKDLTLAIARRAKAAIEARLGIRVLLTRDDDRNVPIEERAAIANNNKADLFVSLHANASLRKTTAGASIFCAEFDKDTAKAAAGNADRVPAFGGGTRDIELVLWDLAQTRHLDQSATFAGLLEEQFHDRIPLAAHPVDRAPLRVLESANMPAVLVEMAYLTNADQEKLIAGDAFQNALVQALYDAIVKYRDAVAAGGAR
jgi:N-acetylmuramoyl-L-alanine amidase